MKLGTVHCGNNECKKELAFFPVDKHPGEIELYCTDCKDCLEEQNKEESNG